MKKYNLNINKASILSSNINTFRINGIQNNSKRIIKSSSNSQNVLYNNEIIKKINTNKNSPKKDLEIYSVNSQIKENNINLENDQNKSIYNCENYYNDKTTKRNSSVLSNNYYTNASKNNKQNNLSTSKLNKRPSLITNENYSAQKNSTNRSNTNTINKNDTNNVNNINLINVKKQDKNISKLDDLKAIRIKLQQKNPNTLNKNMLNNKIKINVNNNYNKKNYTDLSKNSMSASTKYNNTSLLKTKTKGKTSTTNINKQSYCIINNNCNINSKTRLDTESVKSGKITNINKNNSNYNSKNQHSYTNNAKPSSTIKSKQEFNSSLNAKNSILNTIKGKINTSKNNSIKVKPSNAIYLNKQNINTSIDNNCKNLIINNNEYLKNQYVSNNNYTIINSDNKISNKFSPDFQKSKDTNIKKGNIKIETKQCLNNIIADGIIKKNDVNRVLTNANNTSNHSRKSSNEIIKKDKKTIKVKNNDINSFLNSNKYRLNTNSTNNKNKTTEKSQSKNNLSNNFKQLLQNSKIVFGKCSFANQPIKTTINSKIASPKLFEENNYNKKSYIHSENTLNDKELNNQNSKKSLIINNNVGNNINSFVNKNKPHSAMSNIVKKSTLSQNVSNIINFANKKTNIKYNPMVNSNKILTSNESKKNNSSKRIYKYNNQAISTKPICFTQKTSPKNSNSKLNKDSKISGYVQNYITNIKTDNKIINKEIIGTCNDSEHKKTNLDSFNKEELIPNFFKKEADNLKDYIKTYYQKNKEYPPTSVRFYKYGRLLGRGAFGKVNLGLHVLTGRLVAIKSFNKSNIPNDRAKKKILQEVKLMQKLKQNSVVKIYETFETPKYLVIIMEYISGGDLLSFVKKRNKLNESSARYIFRQLITALELIHSQNVVHRDIKLDNILLDINNNIKICDFGVGKLIRSKKELLYDQCGTPAYIAPDILKNNGYEGPQVDIWSAGVVLYAMLSGMVPFKAHDMNKLHELILNGDYEALDNISKEAMNLINQILCIDSRKRLTSTEILNHIWMCNEEFDENGYYKKMDLFSNAEKIILAKSDIDYRNHDKECNIENFTIKNLETKNDIHNKNVATKSIILAPFNSTLKNSKDEDYIYDLEIDNNFMKMIGKVKEANLHYELNNNADFDNAVFKENKDKNKEQEQEDKSKLLSPNDFKYKNSNMMSPNDFSNRHSGINTPRGESLQKNQNNNITLAGQTLNTHTLIIDNFIIKQIEEFGYSKEYILKCLNNYELNYATSCYYILLSVRSNENTEYVQSENNNNSK